MARPEKKGIDYYPMEVGVLKERRMHSLIKKLGSDAVAVFIHVLNESYGNKGYYVILDDDFFDFATDVLYINEDRIRDIIDRFCEKDFFQKMTFEGKTILTSEGIQERFLEIVKGARRKSKFVPIPEIWLLQNDDESNVYNNPENEGFLTSKTLQKPPESTQIKEKKIKEKETKTKPVWYPFNTFTFLEFSKLYTEEQIRDAVNIATQKGNDNPEYVRGILQRKYLSSEEKPEVKRPDPNCKKCNGTGWVFTKNKDGQEVTHRCDCFK